MRIFILSLVLLISTISFSQKGPNESLPVIKKEGVHGQVVDSLSFEYLEFVAVRLLDSENQFIQGASTDSLGQFSLKGTFNGFYTLKISFIGFNDKLIPLSFDQNTSSFDVGKIGLKINSFQDLQEVLQIQQTRIQN